MAQPPERSIREVLLDTVRQQHEKLHGGSLQQAEVLSAVKQLLVPHPGNPELEEAILTQWFDLFRTGLLSWGTNLNNPNPPYLHLTGPGRQALATAARDPSNPAGYLQHLEQTAVPIGFVAKSYVIEALDCYVAGLYKAAAVMIGTAAEASILEIRDLVAAVFRQAETPNVPPHLNSWQVKKVTEALAQVFDERIDKKTHRELRERFEAHWGALTHEIRTTRNDAGHPTSIDP